MWFSASFMVGFNLIQVFVIEDRVCVTYRSDGGALTYRSDGEKPSDRGALAFRQYSTIGIKIREYNY